MITAKRSAEPDDNEGQPYGMRDVRGYLAGSGVTMNAILKLRRKEAKARKDRQERQAEWR